MAITYTRTINGTDAIFLAGRTDLLIPSANLGWGDFNAQTYDGMLRHSGPTPEEALETLPPEILVPSGSVIRILSPATGSINYFNGFGPPEYGPDGNSDPLTSNLEPFAGISGYIGPQGALVGVFLSDDIPIGSPPATLDFSPSGYGVDFPSLSPGIGQVFFIGDGMTSGNAPQEFIAPAGATRLVLGIADGFGFIGVPGAYDDNNGAFQITFEVIPSNHPPVVSGPVLVTLPEDTVFTLNLLAGASDPDAGDTLHVNNVTGLVAGMLLEGNSLQIDGGAFNSLSEGENPIININYVVIDGKGGAVPQTAIITIRGENDVPTAAPDFATVQKGGAVTGNLLANDTDPDHDALHIIGGQSIKGSNGVLTLNDGNYSYLAYKNAKTGAHDVFIYSVTDGHETVNQSLTVTIQDDAGNSLNSARYLGTLGSASYLPISEWVGAGDPVDYFKFVFTGKEQLKLGLTDLHGDVDLFLLNNKGDVIEHSHLAGTSGEVIWETLTSGTYYVKVENKSGSTDYNLRFEFSPFSSTTLPSIPLPFDSDYSDMYVSQGWGVADPSHEGNFHYALDFSRPNPGPAGVVALSVGNNGKVIEYRDNVRDGEEGNSGLGNYITIEYVTSEGEYFYATYMHLKYGSITEALRDELPAGLAVNLNNAKKFADLDIGEDVGKIGDTGRQDYDPHLHFQFSHDHMLLFGTYLVADASAANGQTHTFISENFPYEGNNGTNIPDDRLEAYADFGGYRSDVDNDFWFH